MARASGIAAFGCERWGICAIVRPGNAKKHNGEHLMITRAGGWLQIAANQGGFAASKGLEYNNLCKLQPTISLSGIGMATARTLSGRYRLLVKVGEGGMAEVYRTQDVLLGRAVAVKLLRPQYNSESAFLVRFLQEAQAAAGLSHPNIVTVYDVGQDGEQRYIVMEYVEGVNLKEIILESAPFGTERVVDVGLQICRAVAVAHRAGLVHRDIKPQNVLLTGGGRVKVTDFGIARALAAPKGLTEEGTVWGTPHYISPEQASGQEVGPASDVYSIGVVLFEMLTGRLPFEGESSVAIAMKHVREAPPPISRFNPRVPSELARIVARAMAKSPDARYASAGDMAHALRSFQRTLQGLPDMGEPAASHSRAAPAGRPPYLPEPASPRTMEPMPEDLPSRSGHERLDALTLFLVVIAFLAMVGLIPVGIFVIQTYAAKPPPPPPPIPTPTAFVLADDVRVPSLMGQPHEAALSMAAGAGLRMEVAEQRHHDSAPTGTVIEQERPAGQKARRGDVVRVVLSLGAKPQIVQLPRLVGRDLVEAGNLLQELGLQPSSSAEWGGTVPRGVVLAQEPAEGSSVPPGSGIQLTVSNGPELAVRATLNGAIVLTGVELERDQLTVGESLTVSLLWSTNANLPEDYNVFVHLLKDGQPVVQQDNPPVGGQRPTSGWVPRQETIRDTYSLAIPFELPPGDYWLAVGMYRPGDMQRLPVTNPGAAQMADNALLIRPIQVQGR